MHRPNLFCLLLLLITTGITSAARAVNNTFDNDSTKESALITRFHFKQYYGGVVVIQALVSNYPDTLQFILDTGSAGISLDTATCLKMGITNTPSDRIIKGLGGAKPVSYAMHHTLRLPGLNIDSLDFHINDYELISQVYGIQVDGIIGFSLLSRYIVTVDYDTEEILIYSKGRFNYPKGGQLLRPSLTQIPLISAPLRVNKKYINNRYYFDTGAGMCLLLSTQFVKDSSIMERRKRSKKIIQTEAQGLGGKMQMSLTTVSEFRIGNYAFRNVPTYIFDDKSNVTAYPFLGGMIGNDLLRRFNITLNYAKKEIYLVPNSHYRDAFDYSYTGLIIYLINGRVEVTDVIKNSPAEKAGFRKGDIIMAINNNLGANLQLFREILKNIGSKAIILISRDNDLIIKKLPIKSIL
ncbi:aspartyl protease family protein [Chitinophaga nivalis]|uniref:Aspartyl protease family protein n=1 Tax=Chitinophaga nivalis TaxID=2991709 RepID=A0ABT3IV40_9BACT|nr:aspartyl protease family protein [Chitinophaga nivalis]MCW3462448.1 aspartyl protease family protein [Chitinophaga nivalis]MCW3487861.1 aspartyl protease family protein [Chitinophaga nivalis]